MQVQGVCLALYGLELRFGEAQMSMESQGRSGDRHAEL
jgi:hypothetical protein